MGAVAEENVAMQVAIVGHGGPFVIGIRELPGMSYSK
jgi:hypothetical protein